MAGLKGFVAALFFLIVAAPCYVSAQPQNILDIDISLQDINHLNLSWDSSRSLRYEGTTVLVQKRSAIQQFKTIKKAPGAAKGRIKIRVGGNVSGDYRLVMRRGEKTIGRSAVISLFADLQNGTGTTSEQKTSTDTTLGSVQSPKNRASCPDDVVEQVFYLISQYRMGLGLTALRANGPLNRASELHSIAMADAGIMSHDGWFEEVQSVGYNFSFLAQNVAYGYTDPSQLVNAWIASPGHRANIEDPRSIDAGISCIKDSTGRFWWTNDFGSPR